MRGLRVAITFFLMMSTGFFSCGYGGPGGGGSPECRSYCQKTEGCCEYYPDCEPVSEDDMNECMCKCTNMYRTVTTKMLQGMQACADIPCENYTERDACMENLVAVCTGTSTPAVEAFCNRVEQCSLDVSYDECIQFYSQIIGCYSAKTQAAMLSCSSSGTCETFSMAFEQCMNTQLGLLDCAPED